MNIAYSVGGVDYSSEMVDLDGSPQVAFPDAPARPEALAEEAVTGVLSPDRLSDASFQVTHFIRDLADADAVAAAIAERVRAYYPEQTILIAEEGKTTLTGRVRTAFAAAHANHGTWGYVTIAGTRYGPWEGADTAALDASGEPITEYTVTLPGVVHIRGTKGEMPARTRVKITTAQVGSLAAVGFRPGADTGLTPTQDYQGTVDTRCLSGQGTGQGSLGTTYQTIGTATTLDANKHRGRWLVLARLANDVATEIRYRAASFVKGSGALNSIEQATYGQEVRAAHANDGFEVANLGVMRVPGVEVPSYGTSAALGASSAIASQTTGATKYQITSGDGVARRAALVRGTVLSSVTAKVYAPAATTIGAYVYAADNLSLCIASGDLAVADGTDGTVVIPFDTYATPAPWTGDFYVCIGYDYLYENPVASGGNFYKYTLTRGLGGGGGIALVPGNDATKDLYMVLTGRVPLSFDASVRVQGYSAVQGSGTAILDTVALVPADYCAYATYPDWGAGFGVIFDNMPADASLRRAYIGIASTSDAAPSALMTTKAEGYGLYLPAGDSECVVMAETPKAAAPTTGKLSITYTPLYETRGGD